MPAFTRALISAMISARDGFGASLNSVQGKGANTAVMDWLSTWLVGGPRRHP
jgi:hypothetical protein